MPSPSVAAEGAAWAQGLVGWQPGEAVLGGHCGAQEITEKALEHRGMVRRGEPGAAALVSYHSHQIS